MFHVKCCRMFFVNFPGCFRHKSQVAETWVLSFQDIFNGINLKPCSMVIESLIYVKIFGGAIPTLKCCTVFCSRIFSRIFKPKKSQSARLFQPRQRFQNPAAPAPCKRRFFCCILRGVKGRSGNASQLNPTKTQPLDPQNP